MQYFSFSVWLISLSIMPSRSIHVADGRISFFIADNILYMCIEKSYCLYPFVCQHAFRFPLYLKLKLKSLSPIRLFATPWTGAHQAPLSMGFSRQEYWSGLPFPSPGESSWPRDWAWVCCIAGRFFTIWSTREAPMTYIEVHYLFKLVFLFSSSKHPEVELLNCMVIVIFWGTFKLFLILCALSHIPTNTHKGSLLSTSLPILDISCLSDSNHSNRCEEISHCSLDLHFFDN